MLFAEFVVWAFEVIGEAPDTGALRSEIAAGMDAMRAKYESHISMLQDQFRQQSAEMAAAMHEQHAKAVEAYKCEIDTSNSIMAHRSSSSSTSAATRREPGRA